MRPGMALGLGIAKKGCNHGCTLVRIQGRVNRVRGGATTPPRLWYGATMVTQYARFRSTR